MERQTALLITEGLKLNDAIDRGTELVDGLLAGLPFVHDPSRTQLYAVGLAGSLRAKLSLPRKLPTANPFETATGPLCFIWTGGAWFTPDDCPPAPWDDNEASAWQWLHYNAMHGAAPDAACLLWDIYPPRGGRRRLSLAAVSGGSLAGGPPAGQVRQERAAVPGRVRPAP
jgi:hypothetical protein